MPSSKLRSSVPACRSLRRFPFRSIPSASPPAWPPSGSGTLFARVSCMRALAAPASCASAARAPDCAREAAGATRLSVPAGAFCGPSHCFPAQKSERRPRKPNERRKPLSMAAQTGPCRASPAASASAQAGRFMNDPCNVSWIVMFLMPPPKLCGSVPAYRLLRRVPLHSVRAAAGLGAPRRRDPFCARILRARPCPPARVSAGAVRAADCARETEGARLPFVPAGAFFGPSPCFPAQKSG